jgi:Domain of unknown function (DUF4178)
VELMTNARAPQVKVQALFCPNCGGQVELRGFANTLTAVCTHCATVLDTSTPAVQILHKFDERQIRKPAIPLGTRGKFDNTTYEAIGFQVRGIEDDETVWEWAEYVLFNPYRGFLYLTEYHGHWNLVRPVHALPAINKGRLRPVAAWHGRTYGHFQHAMAKTLFVLGEFPWRVQVDEKVIVDDYTCPPFVLSAESTDNETTWSEGEYLEGRQVWQALGLKGSPPQAYGTYLNQPSPQKGNSRGVVALCGVLEIAVLALLLFFLTFDRRETVLNESHQFVQTPNAEASFVTSVFALKGHPSSVVIETHTDVDNHWVYLNYALINSDTGHAYDFGREVGYYYGRDSDGSWTEGGRNDRIRIPSVAAGSYYLRVEPEGEPNSPPVHYTIVVRRDVPNYTWYVIAALSLPLPAIFITWRRYRFEYQRWQESDYAVKWSKSES